MAEVTLKDIYEIVGQTKTELKLEIANLKTEISNIDKSFKHFEEGKVSDLIQRTTRSEGELSRIKDELARKGVKEESSAEKRKDWVWGAIEKIIFMLIIPLIGLVLIKTGIININY